MIYNKFIPILVLGLLVLTVMTFGFGQYNGNAFVSNNKVAAFKSGERLTYLTSYKVGFINVDVAKIDFTVKEEDQKDEACYRVQAIAETMPQFSWFFDMRDEYNVWLSKNNLRPVLFKNNIKEGTYIYNSEYDYDWTRMEANTYEKRDKWESHKNHIVPLTEVSYDALSLFYNLRCIPLDNIKENVYDTLTVVFCDEVRRIGYKFAGREELKVKGLGVVRTLKFVCQLADKSGVSFKDGNEFSMWLSDDKNRIPIYLETPIKIGSVRVRLSYYEGLLESINTKKKK